jgi:hypothetical protein
MRTLAVVVADSIRNLRAGVIEAVEQLVAHPAIEAFTEAVLRPFSRRPGQHGVAGELGAVVRDNHARLAPRRQAFPGHVIDDIQDLEAATIGELIMDKIQRPAGIRPSLDRDRRPDSDRAAASPALTHTEAFLR